MSKLKSPVSWLTDTQFNALPIKERFLHQAASYVGQKEVGTNWGLFVKATLKFSGVGVPAPWCAAFVTRVLVETGFDKKKLPKYSASTYWWWKLATDKKALITPASNLEMSRSVKRGMLFVWNGKGGGHIGVIVKVNSDGTFETIEGNTNSQGSREGDRVTRKTRTLSLLKRYPRWGFIDIEKL